MRMSVATIGMAAFAALLAGCSSMSQDRQTLPNLIAAPPPARIGGAQTQGTAARAAFASQLEGAGHDPKAVRLWVVNNGFNYLLGLSESGKQILDTINVGANGCLTPSSVKVDANQNVWIGCQGEPAKGYADGASEQEYSSSGVLRRSYRWTGPCPPSATICAANGAGDGGPDNRGHVFAELGAAAILVNGVQQNLDPGFYWWPENNPRATPKFISIGKRCQPICTPVFMDTDRLGNVWFTYGGVKGGRGGYGLAEIVNPTTKPHVITIFGVNPYIYLSGVFMSNAGRTLNVVNTTERKIYQYALPVTPRSKPFKTLGPTLSTFDSIGIPITGGFNKAETKLAIGDDGGWLNLGTVASNQWKSVLNLYLFPNDGAASYTPSDR